MSSTYDVIIIGAGAAGLMCASTAGYRGRSVLVLDHTNKPGKKILMSGGGRCNFTNLNSTPANFLSDNPNFCISALKRYTPQDFLELVDRHGIEHEEKAAGQFFCKNSAKDILNLLLTECGWAGVNLKMKTNIESVMSQGNGYHLKTSSGSFQCESLVIASGGLSIPTMGSSSFGYDIAKQFGVNVLPTSAALVPFTLPLQLKERLAPMAGVSCSVEVNCNGAVFREPMLITHRGLSGPAMLQISSFWHPGDAIHINLLPGVSVGDCLHEYRRTKPQSYTHHFLEDFLPKRFARAFSELQQWIKPFQFCHNEDLKAIADVLSQWEVHPAGTEGYKTAEVTLGGVDTRDLSSKTMSARNQPGLFFIGEVLDVTGHLGGHNFQWAWASGVAAGQHV
ncbi:NAD(P)/FAD-dependent oxidoreductase [Vreelandella titanicae]|uniref:NAD(P)/FAD-dependent oxidoreductase n=1 Tax=Vreelandella titanicae TaxID=664683 RepID=UPI0015935FCF|nr:NAD(P)/FAD-dependent oxidoreductase [Halomonas titanicae]NVE90728.1 NAD(P)/FAD-dependent oxidoreductase [Halomonas titanicae]